MEEILTTPLPEPTNSISSNLLRLNVLTHQIGKGMLNKNLEWQYHEIP